MLLFAALVMALNIWLLVLQPKAILDEWAASQGFEVVHSERRWLFLGPFSWFTPENQAVYHVTVRDANGIERSGFLRCGGFFLGLFSKKAEVRWDD